MKLLKPLLWLWPFYLMPENYVVRYAYYSFGAKYPSVAGAQYYRAETHEEATQHFVHWTYLNPLHIHRPLYAGKYKHNAYYLHWLQRIRCKWFKKKVANA